VTGDDLLIVKQLLNKDLDLAENELEGLETNDQLILRKNLKLIIGYLLEHDFNRLVNACYRLDIAQEKFQKILECSTPDQLSEDLTDLVIKREMEKVKWRKLYVGRN